EVPVPRRLPLRGLGREALRGSRRSGVRPRLRSTTAVFTTVSALAASSMVSAPSVAEPFTPAPCAPTRTDAHHSEGLDTCNAAYPRPTRRLDAVMVFLSFPASHPPTTPADLPADHFPAPTDFLDRASYRRSALR